MDFTAHWVLTGSEQYTPRFNSTLFGTCLFCNCHQHNQSFRAQQLNGDLGKKKALICPEAVQPRITVPRSFPPSQPYISAVDLTSLSTPRGAQSKRTMVQ